MTIDVDAPRDTADEPDDRDADGGTLIEAGSERATGGGGGPASPLWYRLGLVAVAVLGLGVRLLNVLVWRPTCDVDLVAVVEQGQSARYGDQAGSNCFRIWGDSAYYYIQGRMNARGHWFIDSYSWFASNGALYKPSSGNPPMFSLLLGLLTRIGLASGAQMRVATCVVGTAGVVLLAVLVRRLAGPRAALIAGVIAAVYPMLWINDGMLLSETLYVPMILVAILAAYTFWERPTMKWAATFGVAMGLAALTRGEALILLAVMPLPLLWGLRRLGWAQVAKLGAVAIGVGLLVVAPWIGFNLTRFHHPALMTSSTGAVLSSANCDITYYTDSIGYYGNCFDEYVAQGKMVGKLPGCTPEVVEAIAADPKSPEASKCWPNDPSFDETDRDRFSQELAIDYMKTHLRRLPVVMAARVGRMWDVYTQDIGRDDEPLGQNVRFNWQVEGRGKLSSEVGLVGFLAMLPVAVGGGVWLWLRRVPLSPLLAMTIVITVTAAFTFGITRYRVPVDVVVVILTAAGIEALVSRFAPARDGGTLNRSRSVLPAVAGTTTAAAAPAAGPGPDDHPDDRPAGRPAGTVPPIPPGAADALARIVPADDTPGPATTDEGQEDRHDG